MTSTKDLLLTVIVISWLAMFASFFLDRIVLQGELRRDIGEKWRQVWGVAILAICFLWFIYRLPLPELTKPNIVWGFLGVGSSGGFDLVAHAVWRWATWRGKEADNYDGLLRTIDQLSKELATLRQQNEELTALAHHKGASSEQG